MRHRAPETTCPDLDQVGAGGPLRIGGAYPPRLAPTRYDRSGSHATLAWAGTAALLAAASAAGIVVGLSDGARPARLDVPLAVVAAPAPAPDPTPARGRISITGAPARPVLQLPASDPVRIRIPALGVTSEVMRLDLRHDGSMEVPPAAYPVGWYDRSPTPGELGPAVLAGHVDWKGDPGAFYGLRELLPGDLILIDRADGTVATFQIDRVEQHAKDDFPTDAVYGDLPSAGLRLITCGGSFDGHAGEYRDNVVAFAGLVATA